MKRFLLFLTACLVLSMTAVAADKPQLEVKVDSTPIKPVPGGPVVSYGDVLEKATPSVVSVYTSRIVASSVSGRVPPGMEELFRQFGLPLPPQGRDEGAPRKREQHERVGVGSGVIFSEDGYIVTNRHVIEDESGQPVDEIRVSLSDGREFIAELVGSDPKTDVAVLRVQVDEPLPAITLANSDQLRVGDVVFAIGNPLNVGLTATQGIVSATGRDSFGILGPGAYENFIQTDASINLGNSGGALIDAWGRLVGINTAIVSGSGGSIGIGFAIPVDMVLNVATNLIEKGEVPRGMLGLFPENLTPDMADAFGLSSTKGALVNQVQDDSPAARAGIRHGDVIVRIGDTEIDSAPELRLVISQMLPGTEVQVTLIRQGETLTLPVVLGSLNGSVESLSTGVRKQGILDGVFMRPLNDAIRREFSIPEDIEGVFVDEVSMDSPYAESIVRGMVIIEVNGEVVNSPYAVKANLKKGVNRLYTWFGSTKRFGFVVIRIQE